jgi:hypothetical protein
VTLYEQGGAYEVKTKNALIAEGYSCWLARGSKGFADVLAIKPGQILLVQVKSGAAIMPASGGMGHAEWNGLYELALQLGAVPISCWWRKWARRPAWNRLTGLHLYRSQTWPSEQWSPDEVARGGSAAPLIRARAGS